MIIDYIKNSSDYYDVLPGFQEGMEFALSLREKSAGRYEKGEMFAMVQEGVTENLEDGNFEAHKNYVDVQIVVDGEELVEWEDVSNLLEVTPYNPQKDVAFSKGKGQIVNVKKDMFYLVFPHDAHKPCRHNEIPTIYKKIVLKLKVN